MQGFLRCRTVVASAILLFSTLTVALADRFPADPVEDLRQTLRATHRDPGPRERNLKVRIEALKTLSQMRRALILQEWRDEDPDDKIAAIDQPLRKELAGRFERGIRGALESSDVTTRRAAANLLAEIGTSIKGVGTKSGLARVFAPDLAERIKKDDPVVRETAARALGLINPEPEIAVTALAGLLASGNEAERAAAAEAFYNLIYNAARNATLSKSTQGIEVTAPEVIAIGKAVIPAAGKGLADTAAPVRQHAAGALNQAASAIGKLVGEPRSSEEVGAVEEYRKEIEAERGQLMPVMVALKGEAPALAKAVADPDTSVRIQARHALEEMGVARVRLLRRAQSLATAEREMGGELKEKPALPVMPEDPLLDALRIAMPALALGVSDPDMRAQLAAIEALETLITEGSPAAGALVKALDDDDRFVRWAAARVLGRIGPVKDVDAVTPLIRLLNANDLDLARSAALALSRYGPPAKDAVPSLIQALRATDAELRVAVIRTLEGIGTDSTPAIPAIGVALRDRDSRVRVAAAEALGKFGPTATEAVPALRAALDDENGDVRRAASDALLSILPLKG